MDDLLSEFLTETSESLDVVDVELVKFERDPQNSRILDNIFRLVHTVKGTCGFLGLPRLEALAHAAETLLGTYRDGAAVTHEGVSCVLQSVDRIKQIVRGVEETGAEPEGSDADLIARLEALSGAAGAGEQMSAGDTVSPPEGPAAAAAPGAADPDTLEHAFREVPGPEQNGMPGETVPARAAEAAQAGDEAAQSEAALAPDPAAVWEGMVNAQSSIRVNVDTLEQLMTMVSELVLTRNQLLEMVRRLDESEFKTPLQRLSAVTAELQDAVMKTRMQPIGKAWQKLPRVVRDLAEELGKSIDLQMHGDETELDRQVLELITDPLTHMVRNSAGHGLESAEERRRAGKPETGTISLSARHEGGHIIIEVADDGCGVNAGGVKRKAVASGLATQAELEAMSPAEIYQFIFKPGFSTASSVTSVSGRGVGMDVVRANIELIGGTVDLQSTSSQGSTFIIKIPLTLAIVSALIVEAQGQRFAIPQLSVMELVRTHRNGDHRIESINGAPVLRLRDALLPLIRLGELLKLDAPGDGADAQAADGNHFVVILQVGAQMFALLVDNVFDTEEIVVKPMSRMLRDIPLFSGNTILGDGSVIMILDPNGVAQSVAQPGMPHAERADAREEETSGAARGETTPLLVFRAGSEEPKAVPLSLVTRLEEIDTAAIERANGKDMIQYRGALMPLAWADGEKARAQQGERPVLVFNDEHDRALGLAVDEIVDIVEDRLTIDVASDTPGMVGSAIVNGKATGIVDIGYYLDRTYGQRGRGRGLAVLLVDDSAFFRNMLAPLLSAAGHDVTLADSARRTLELRDQGARFDVIVCDLEMPEMDGIALAGALRDEPRWRDTPIIALSPHSASRAAERGREAGFADFVGKFDRTQLMESIEACRSPMGAAA